MAIACRGRGELRVLDPCCGGGTILYEAWSRGHRVVGVEIQELWARYAAENLEAMSGAAVWGTSGG